MEGQRNEILWNIDWDELDPATPGEQLPDSEDLLEPAQSVSNPVVEALPDQKQTNIPASRHDSTAVQTTPVPRPPPPIPVTPDPIYSDQPLLAAPQQGKVLVRGERFDLGPIFAQRPQISMELISSNPALVKLICLGLDAAEIVAGVAYCVGPRQPASPCGGITHAVRSDGGQEILVRASILPPGIKRLEISVVTSDSGASLGNTVEGIKLRVGDLVVAEFRDLDPACASSSCATLVEIYERQGTWRMRVIGEVLARSVNDLLAKHGAKTN